MDYSKYLFYLCTQQKYVINISQTTIASIISYKHITMAFNWPTIIRKSHHHVYTVITSNFIISFNRGTSIGRVTDNYAAATKAFGLINLELHFVLQTYFCIITMN